jgi:hypothetical protein
MSDWTLLHMRSPLNTAGGSTGQYGELSMASSRSFSFSTEQPATLNFTMPGNHRQTGQIEPLVSDVLVFRDDYPVDRFRVVSRALTKDSGRMTATFAAVSYRALLDAWIFHDSDTRSWASPIEQTLMAWNILNEGQLKSSGGLGITRGVLPQTAVNRTLTGSAADGDANRPEYFLAGMKRSEAIDNIAHMINGFEWSIEPDVGNPYRALKFNTWNFGQRNQHATRSDLLLDDGGSMMSWSHTVTPTEYANVIRFTGADTTQENDSEVQATPILPAWSPSSRNPTGGASEGRWERALSDTGLTTQQAVNDRAPQAFANAHNYLPEITATLRRGSWRGPEQLWLGDKARLIITEPVLGPATGEDEWILYIDEDVRVVEVKVNVDDLGAEDVQLSLNRPAFSTLSSSRNLSDRLTRLEIR